MTIMGRARQMAAALMCAAVSAIDQELAPAAAKFKQAVENSEPVEPKKPDVRVVVTESLLYNLDTARGNDRMAFHKRIERFRSRVTTFVVPDDNGKMITCKVDPRTIRVDGPLLFGMVHMHLEPGHVFARAEHPPKE